MFLCLLWFKLVLFFYFFIFFILFNYYKTGDGFYVTNFQGAEQGGPIGKHLTVVGDAKESENFFAVLTKCRSSSSIGYALPLSYSPSNYLSRLPIFHLTIVPLDYLIILYRSPGYLSNGGIWTTQFQPMNGPLDIFFAFSVDPCTASSPNGFITLVLQTEGYIRITDMHIP